MKRGSVMHVVILGGSGFIGNALAQALVARGEKVIIPTRVLKHAPSHPLLQMVQWDGRSVERLSAILEGANAVINLIGENISGKRWTEAQKERLVQSRVQAGKALIQALRRRFSPPRMLIQASAVGYYGFWNDSAPAPACTESTPSGTGFLARTAVAWEASTAEAEEMGIRLCVIRTAPVLGPNGGMLQKMLPLYRLGLGGPVGTGKQPFAWIQLDDEVNAILFLRDNPALSGVFNLVSPQETTMNTFAQTLGTVLHRPARLVVPGVLLRLGLGEMAEELLLAGQKVIPSRLLEAGFQFSHANLEDALRHSLPSKT